MAAPPHPSTPPVQRLRIRYAKRGRLRFTSHRDFARAFERALRRAGVPVAFSAGFSPHPKVSYVGAAPTGAASEAEYLELALAERRDPERVRAALDAALPAGLDLLEAVEAGAGALPDRMEASHWRVALPGVAVERLDAACRAFLAAAELPVERLTKSGRRRFDARGPVVSARACRGERADCAIMDLVVRHVTPTVRPDDVLAGLAIVADLAPAEPPRATRLAQGPLDADGRIADPLGADRQAAAGAGSAQPEPRT